MHLQIEVNKSHLVSYNEINVKEITANKKSKTKKLSPYKEFKHRHIEDNYNDFLEEKLIPYKISTYGPAVAVADIDNNGDYETVLSYNRNGKYYPLKSRQKLASQFNVINRLFIDNKSFSGKSLNQIFGRVLDKAKKYTASTLASIVLINENGIFNTFKI